MKKIMQKKIKLDYTDVYTKNLHTCEDAAHSEPLFVKRLKPYDKRKDYEIV